jgi:hypothetical protein
MGTVLRSTTETYENGRPFPPVIAYVSWCFSFGPALYILGAKRPQHLGWNAVVVALIALVSYPAIQWEIMRPGEKLNLGNIWPWFLAALLLVSPLVYVATRYQWAALLVGLAQATYFLPHLPFAGGFGAGWFLRVHVAFGLLVLAGIVAERSFRNRRETLHPADAIWLDFRDTFGIFWGLRFAERINEAAERFGWPVRLEWGGFVVVPHDSPQALNDALDQALTAELRPTMRGLLRRFVDQAWIERRLNRGTDFLGRPDAGETPISKYDLEGPPTSETQDDISR